MQSQQHISPPSVSSPSRHSLDVDAAPLSVFGRLRASVKKRTAGKARTLKVPRDGKALIGITLMVGFAAINTGNNLLFFGWGLLLATILISGILSESTLRAVSVSLVDVGECRALSKSPMMLRIENPGARLPAFGIASGAFVDDSTSAVRCAERSVESALAEARGDDENKGRRSLFARKRDRTSTVEAKARYQLRLHPGASETLTAQFSPTSRGVHLVRELFASTAYPFGFFEKTRRYLLETPRELLVYPARVDVGPLDSVLLSRLGQSPTHTAGAGDEYFSMRPWREGDDPRAIAWRVSARTGRAVVKETEVWATREVILVIQPAPAIDTRTTSECEAIIAACASIAEDLMAKDHAVGILAPGLFLSAARGPRQRDAILAGLARVSSTNPLAHAKIPRQAVAIGITIAGQGAPSSTSNSIGLTITVPPSVIADLRTRAMVASSAFGVESGSKAARKSASKSTIKAATTTQSGGTS